MTPNEPVSRAESARPESGSEAARGESSISAEALARAVGITHATLIELVRLGVAQPAGAGPSEIAPTREFPMAALVRVRRVLRIHGELEMDIAGAAVVVDLLDRLARLEGDLERLRRAVERGEA